MTPQEKNTNLDDLEVAGEQPDLQSAKRRIHNPHDALFLALLSSQGHAKAFVRDHLPERIVGQLADAPPEIMNANFVDKGLNRRFADLLLKCKTASEDSNLFLVLNEHKSKPSSGLLLQLYSYVGETLKQFSKGQPVMIIVLAVYTGQEEWNGPTNFCELFGYGNPDVKNFIPDWPIVFLNLRKILVEQLSQLALLRAGWTILTGRAPDHQDVFSELGAADDNWPLREQLISYTYSEYGATA